MNPFLLPLRLVVEFICRCVSQRRTLVGAGLLSMAMAACCLACNVPVFRYALDHWSADQYRLLIVSHGPLSEADEQTVQSLAKAIESRPVNVVLRRLDLSAQSRSFSLDPALLAVETKKIQEHGPQAVLLYPAAMEIAESVWRGNLDATNLEAVLDSPARRELIKRLCAGHSAVWLLVACGDPEKDQPARRLLEQQLSQLQTSLELPKLTDAPEDAVVGGPALRIEFSTLELNRHDEQERALLSMLLRSEPDLWDAAEPLVFPVFGRGRALWPLVGPGIEAGNIAESARFLCGACSCQVKEQNPGFDLVLNADWEKLMPWTKSTIGTLQAIERPEAAQLVPIPSGEQDRRSNAAQPAAEVTKEPGSMWIVASGLVMLAGCVWFLLRR